MNRKVSLQQLVHYLTPYKWQLIIATILMIMSAILIIVAPATEGLITTNLLNTVNMEEAVNFNYILRISIILMLVYTGNMITIISYQFILTGAIQNAMEDLRNEIQKKIHRLPVSYFDGHTLGDILSRVTTDMETISNALQQSLAPLFMGMLGIVLAVAMMLFIHVAMAVVAICIIPISMIIAKVIVARSQGLFLKQQNALGALNSVIQEKYTGFKEITLYGKQEDSILEFKEANRELCESGFQAQFISGLMSPLISFVTFLGIAIIVLMGGTNVAKGIISVGALQAFIRYVWQVNQPLTQMTQLSATIQASFAAMDRVFGFLQEQEEVKEKVPSAMIDNVQGNVRFEDLSFGYDPKRILLHDLNVDITSGQMVAIVGPTGVGKTTLINLLMRFYDVNKGAIVIDGVDIRDMKRDDLRSFFGMVLQDTWLFKGSIRDNIAYGKEDATDEEVIAAAKVANAHHFITTLPDGYHMEINEEANNVSQGEKQLLTIARAVLVDPAILILDEATSSVDTRLEQMLQDAMQRIMKGRTSFVIAHRLSTIRNADVILVMKDGNITEKGTHDELLARKGYYEQLYQAQFAHQEH